MAIVDYTTLQSAVADWLNRSDLTSQIPDFITFAEAKFNRTLRLREMVSRRVTTTINEFIALPLDFLETYQLQLAAASPTTQLHYIGLDEMSAYKAQAITGNPRYYTIIDGSFEFFPAPTSDTELHLIYFAKIPSLSSDNQTNWLLSKAPDLYLYTALANAAPYLNNDERIPVWLSLAQSAADELTMDSERAMRSRTNLTARRRGF